MAKFKDSEREKAILKNLDDRFYFENNRKFCFKVTLKDDNHNNLANVIENFQYETINDYEKIKLDDGTIGSFYMPKENGIKNNIYKDNLGSFLIEILNNCNEIIKICYDTKQELEDFYIDENNYSFVYILDILKKLIDNLKSRYQKYYVFLIFSIENFISHQQKMNRNFFGKEFSKLKEKREQQSFGMKNRCIEFINDFINNIKEIKELIDKAFGKSISSYTGKEKTNTELQLMNLSVPKVEIKLGKKEDSSENYKEEIYIYDVENLKEICHISILQLTYNKKVVI